MPRNSSASRKYLLALSRDDSSLWSHRLGGGRRKPDGGGPAGVAALETEVEKLAVERREDERQSEEASREEDGRREATSLAMGLEEAIVEENLGEAGETGKLGSGEVEVDVRRRSGRAGGWPLRSFLSCAP